MQRIGIVLGLFVAGCICGFALNPSLDVSQYAHKTWTVRDGFSLGNIYAMAQTPDGYLWFGTEFGLFRFDGVRTVPWQPPPGQQLPEKNINALLVTRDGTLWIGTFAGLATWSHGKLTRRQEIGRQFVSSLFEDREGTVWVGTLGSPTGRLWAMRSGSVQSYGEDGAFGRAVWALYEDHSGNLWAGAQSGVWRMKPGPPKRYATPAEIVGLSKTGDGRLLIALHGAGLLQLEGDKVKSYPIRGVIDSNRLLRDHQVDSNRLLRDRDGGLWIGTVERGLIHLHDGRTDLFAKSDGLSGDVILSVFEDREGTVWVSSTGGLDRFRELPVATVSVKQGLSSDATQSVLAATDGSVWIGAHAGLTRWKDGKTTIFGRASGLPDDATGSLFQDDRGRIWVSTRHGLAYFKDGRFVAVNTVPGGEVHFITGDNAGNLWLAGHQSLLHVLDDRLVEQIPWPELGRDQSAGVLLPDRGGVWLGLWSFGGLMYFKDHRLRATYKTAEGLGDDNVIGLQLDRDGAVWAATQNGGLSRLKDGRVVATLTTRNGLPCDTINWSIEADDRSFWLYTGCGLVRIARTELDAWIADPNRRVETAVWDAADGVRLRSSAASAYGPRVTRSTDGKLWFVTGEGVQVVDPRHLNVNTVPPPVRIEQVVADGKPYQLKPGLRLPANVRDVSIDYTALSLVAPEKVHFKYMLEGQDPDWKEVIDNRHVHYSNLRPRNYRFRVIACNNSGVWNATGDTLEFSIEPRYYQTAWFGSACVAAFLALLWAGYRFRIRGLERAFRRLRDVIETIPAMAWTALPDGSNAFVNRQWAQYTGLSAEDTAGSGWETAVHPEDSQPYREKWRASVATGEPFEFEARFRCAATGEYRWFLGRGAPLRDKHGNVHRWYGTLTDIEDRKRAEGTLRESETRFRTFVDHVGDAVMVQDEQGTIVDVNRQGCEGLGYARQEVVGKAPSASFCLNANEEATEMESVAQRTAAGEAVLDRHWHLRKDGTVFPVEVHSSLFTYCGRRFLLKTVRDISESLRAEEAVRKSEKQLREAIDTIPAYVWSTLPDGTLDFLNKRCLEFSGYRFEQSLGRGWEAVLHPDDRDRFLQEAQAAIASGEPLETEARYRRADGQYRWLLIRAVPMREETGAIVKWYGANTDIDDLKRAEQALKRSESYLADAQRLTHTGAWASDQASRPLYWSEEMFRIFGFDPKQGLPTLEQSLQRIHPEDVDKLWQGFESSIREKANSEFEFRIVLPDGTVKHARAVNRAIFNPNGDFVQAVGTIVDITELKRAEQERERLRQLEADLAHINRVSMMGELAASIAHEVNQPLSGIVSNGGACLRWLAGEPPNIEEVREAVGDIVRDGRRAGEVIARIRALTRRTAPPKEELDLNEIIREVLAIVGDEAKRNSVMIRTRFADDVFPVLGDRVQLQQVVLNLVMNAIEAMSSVSERPRELVITTRNIDPDQVQVTVEDSGTGLDPNAMTRIFEPFYTTKSGGMGMGLSISRTILQNHGGRLWATANDGPGTSFHVTLPKHHGEEQNAGAAGV